jgi:DNA-binding PadR family transcriptional regulator
MYKAGGKKASGCASRNISLDILGMGPLHGYAIANRIPRASDDFLKVEEGSLYPALHRMGGRS